MTWGSFVARAVGATATGVTLTGPASWDPFLWLDASLDVTAATFQWLDQQAGYVFSEATNKPTESTADADWNSETAIDFDGTNDILTLSTGSVALAAQRFWHDDTTDIEQRLAVKLETDIASGAVIAGTCAATPGTGWQLSWTGTALKFSIYGSSVLLGSVTTAALDLGTTHWVDLGYTTSSRTLAIVVNGAPAVTAVATGTVDTGDADGSLTLCATTDAANFASVEIAFYHVSKTAADATRTEEQITYVLDRYVPTWSGAVGAYTPEDVTLSGSDVTQINDQTGSANHITDSASTTRPSLDTVTYGDAVIDFDGVDEFLNLPSAWSDAVSNGDDLPGAVIIGIRPEVAAKGVLACNVSAADRAFDIETLSSDRLIFHRWKTTNKSVASITGDHPLNTWSTGGVFVPGTTAEWTVGDDPTITTSGDADASATTTATRARLGTNAFSFFQGQLGRLMLFSTNPQGMARAKALRWVDAYTQTL